MVQNYLKFLALYFWARPENSKKKRNLVTVGGTEGRRDGGRRDTLIVIYTPILYSFTIVVSFSLPATMRP